MQDLAYFRFLLIFTQQHWQHELVLRWAWVVLKPSLLKLLGCVVGCEKRWLVFWRRVPARLASVIRTSQARQKRRARRYLLSFSFANLWKFVLIFCSKLVLPFRIDVNVTIPDENMTRRSWHFIVNSCVLGQATVCSWRLLALERVTSTVFLV